MLDIKLFRDNPSLIKESEKRRFKDPKLVDEVLKYDKLWRNEIAKLSKLRSMRNTVSKEINQLKKSGKSANTKITAMRDTSEKISKIDVKAKKYLRTRDELRWETFLMKQYQLRETSREMLFSENGGNQPNLDSNRSTKQI